MDGVELAARFGYITNSLRFCGPKEAGRQFLEYFKSNKDKTKIEESLRRFEGLLPYLSSIANKHEKNVFDYDVVEAYWIGNELLDSFSKDDMKKIIDGLVGRGLPKSIGGKLIKDMPDGLIPHHSFNVMYVGVGKVTGSVDTNLQNMDNCRVSHGKIVEIIDGKLLVMTRPLEFNNNFYLGEEEAKMVVYDDRILKNIKIGDNIGVHWGFGCMKLDNRQVSNLDKYNNKLIEVINSLKK